MINTEIFKKGKITVYISDIVLFALIGFMSAYIGTWAEVILDDIFYKPAIGTMFFWFMIYCMKLPLLFLAAEFLNRTMMAVFAADHYNQCNDHNGWFRNFNHLMLPGELVRFCFSLATLGHPDRTGAFCRVPAWVFEQDYLVWGKCYKQVRELQVYRLQDIGAFVLVYFVYFVLHYFYNLHYYKKTWMKAEEAHRRILNLPIIPTI